MPTRAPRACKAALLPACALALGAPAVARAQAGEGPVPAGSIVVTGVARPADRFDAGLAVSVLDARVMGEAVPRSAAELFRAMPGIRAESSGGEGNANIQMRGIPISSGGAKFLQIQEDGLPILEFGDIAFATADTFTRIDGSVERIEALRGGSASTFASNSPGGIINILSRTGTSEGGAIEGTVGLDYGEYRVDAHYGGRLAEGLRFHLGGFYRVGEGPRRAGYDGNRGGQIRGNITKEFAGGFLRIDVKYLDDRAIAYMPSPVRVTGTDASPTYVALPGLSPQNDTIHSIHFTRALTLNEANTPETDDIRDGMHPVVKSLGFAFEHAFAPGWRVNDTFRYADISGRFIAPFTARAGPVLTLADAIAGPGATAVYANGPNAGQIVPASADALAVVLFNTRLNALDNVTNNLRVNHSAVLGRGRLDLALGFYASRQKIDTDWLWSSYLLQAKGDNGALIDLRDARGALQTERGLVAYGASFFGDCCRRSYQLAFDTRAPYAQLGWQGGAVTLDGSLRYDTGKARGFVAGDGPIGIFDVDGSGTISVPETKVATIPPAQRPVNYDYHYWSYSFGVRYRLTSAISVFTRYSRGGRANADRYAFGGNTSPATGALLPGARPVDFVQQAEAGLKYQSRGFFINATGFHARTQEQNYEATTQKSTAKTYRAYGVELEGDYRKGGLNLSASSTLTLARILASNTASEVGHRPRRQADLTWRLAGSYTAGLLSFGANAAGTTASYAQDSNQLKLPGFTVVNAFVALRPFAAVTVSIQANNLFDVAGYTEAEEGTIPASGIVRARSINGRTVSVALRVEI